MAEVLRTRFLLQDDGDGDFKSKRPFSAEYLPSSYLNRLNSRVSTREQSIDSLESVQGGWAINLTNSYVPKWIATFKEHSFEY